MKRYVLLAAIGVAVVLGLCLSWLCGEPSDGKSEEEVARTVDKLLSLPPGQPLDDPPARFIPLIKLVNENPGLYAPALASHLLVPSGKVLSEKEKHDARMSAALLAGGGTKHGLDALRKYALALFKVMTDVGQGQDAQKSAREIFFNTLLLLLGDLRDPSLAEQVVSIYAEETIWHRSDIHLYLAMTARGDAKVLAGLKKLYEEEKSPLYKDELGQLIQVLSRTNDFSWLPTAFLSKSDKESQQAYLDMVSGFSEGVNGLIAIINNEGLRETNPRAVRAAILALKDFRAEKAVPALARLMDWTPMKGEKDAVNALFRIGKPAANEMLELLASNPPADISNPITVLKMVEGNDVALFRLTKARDAEKDEQRKKNLTVAIDFLTKLIEDEQTPAASGEHPAASGDVPASSSANDSTPPTSGDTPAVIDSSAPRATDTSRPSGTSNATGTGTSSEGGAEGAVAEAAPFPWAIVIVVAIAALALGAITTLLLTRAKKTAK